MKAFKIALAVLLAILGGGVGGCIDP